MIVGGWLVTAGHALIAGEAGLIGAAAATAVWLVVLVVSVIAGLLGLIVACRLFGDDAGSIGLALTRLAGVCAATMAAGLLFSPIVGCLNLIITLGIMAGLVALMFRMDLRAGMIVAVITWIVWFALSLGVTWMTT